MRKLMLVIAVFAMMPFAFAQSSEIEIQKKKLAEVEAQKKALDDQITAIKGKITALTPPVIWKKGGFLSLNTNQVGLSNWAAGGIQAISFTSIGNAFANYTKGKINWENNLDVAYGLVRFEQDPIQKNEDKIDFLSKVGVKASDKLNYAALVNFKSQFADGYDFGNPDEDRPVISKFLAPAFVLASAGFDYRPNEFLSFYISPATGKFTIVNDDSIAALNAYIPASVGNNNFRSEFGALASAIFQKNVAKNIGLRSKLDLFNNFTDANTSNRKNIDVNWETTLNLKVSKYIGMSLFTHFIYDDDINVPLEFDDATGDVTKSGPALQIKEVFGIGFSYKF